MDKMLWYVWGISEPETEYKFHATRKWLFDFAWPARRIAAEIEGGVWSRGRHVRGVGYLKDMEKYNEAQRLGWRVFRFTPQQLKTGEVQTFLLTVFNG